jgi:peptidoglycan/LPS O-acetylase OafA/YrhL
MQSSSGEYRPGLDQLRAVAVFLVFSWHFIHTDGLVTLRPGNEAMGPLSIINLGYVGVSLFMVLSGYLFAGITDKQRIDWLAFMRNRALRLLPLLALVVLGAYLKSKVTGEDIQMSERLLWGWLRPTLPQGGWSVTVEMHFYLLLPLITALGRWRRATWWGLIGVAIALRGLLYQQGYAADFMAYYTLVGRIDQFLLGMLAWHGRGWMRQRHGMWLVFAALFAAGVHYLDQLGAPFSRSFEHPEWWIWLTTVEGLFFAATVAWYDTSFQGPPSRLGRGVALMGRTSYSMYLLHTFWVFIVARWVNSHVVALDQPGIAMLAAFLVFLASAPVAAASFRLIEQPFLRARRPYRHRAVEAQPLQQVSPALPEARHEDKKAA